MSSTDQTLDVARRVAEKDLPPSYNRDWWGFDEAVYKALCNLELMQKLSGNQQSNNDLDLLRAMSLDQEYRHVLRLSILKLQRKKWIVRKSNDPFNFLVSDVLYEAVITRGVQAANRVGQLLKS